PSTPPHKPIEFPEPLSPTMEELDAMCALLSRRGIFIPELDRSPNNIPRDIETASNIPPSPLGNNENSNTCGSVSTSQSEDPVQPLVRLSTPIGRFDGDVNDSCSPTPTQTGLKRKRRSEERRVGKNVDISGRRIMKEKHLHVSRQVRVCL